MNSSSSNQYPSQSARSLSSITDPSQRHSYHSQQDHSSAYQRPQYTASYQQQIPNTLPHPSHSGHQQAYQAQMHATSQSPSYSGAPGTLRDLPFSNVRSGGHPSGYPAHSSSGSFSGQIQPLLYSNSAAYGGAGAAPYASSAPTHANQYIPTPAQTMQYQNLTFSGGSSAPGSSPSSSPGTERFPCDRCDRSFSRSHDRKRHYESHHLQTPHICPTCGKDFSRSDSLKRHIDNGCETMRGAGSA